MSLPDLSVNGFRKGHQYRDRDTLDRFVALIKHHGFAASQFREVSKDITKKLANRPSDLSKSEWDKISFAYAPLSSQQARLALTILIEGGVNAYYDPYEETDKKRLVQRKQTFLNKHEETLESMLSDFFDLNGQPRKATINSSSLPNPYPA